MIRIMPLVLLLAACGVDGPPVRPSDVEDEGVAPGVTLSGSVEVGIARKF